MIKISSSFVQSLKNLVGIKQTILLLVLLFTVTTSFAQKKWTLHECVTYALENNITVKQTKNALLSGEQDIISAKGQFLPSVSGGVGSGARIGSGFDPVSNQRVNNQTTYSLNYSLGVSQNIFNGFRTLNLYKQSRLNQERNSLELARLKDDISLNVVNTYISVIVSKENLEIAIAQYNFSKKQLKQVKELVEVGSQPKANIYDAEAALSRDAQQVTNAENNYNLALLNLSQLLQVPYNGFDIEIIEVDSPSETLLYNDVTPVLNHAFANRNEIKIAEKDMENAVLGTEISKAGYLPSVGFSYGFGSVWSESKNDIFKQALFRELDINKGHSFSLNVNIPIFSRFQNKTAVAKSKIQEENSKLNLDQAKLDLEANVQRAYTDAQAAFKAYEAAKKTLVSQELAFNNSKERYDIGNMTAFDLEQARVQYINAQSSLINAKYDFVFKTKVLDFYMGKSLTN
ncbi:TolC family protein [Sabulilitoribacter arenilitoris]|uniref:TolC family protein n=1 Tax=Wocania arenilitoris TaxID=2044858 RepID=A0AAE3EQH1_9FLAO|nr:TolC family protein [Wocania arenilitoris]MCF7568354.1 TolC family protein [Wocania arenilitoris]